MNWKEIFCRHDWYVINHKTKKQIEDDFEKRKTPFCAPSTTLKGIRNIPLEEKICLKCEMYVNEIKIEENWMIYDKQCEEALEEIRKDKAEAILEARRAWKRK